MQVARDVRLLAIARLEELVDVRALLGLAALQHLAAQVEAPAEAVDRGLQLPRRARQVAAVAPGALQRLHAGADLVEPVAEGAIEGLELVERALVDRAVGEEAAVAVGRHLHAVGEEAQRALQPLDRADVGEAMAADELALEVGQALRILAVLARQLVAHALVLVAPRLLVLVAAVAGHLAEPGGDAPLPARPNIAAGPTAHRSSS